MEFLSGSFVVVLLILVSILIFFFIVIGLPVYLYHRREMLRMKGLANRLTTTLSDRVAALEKRCDRLEERITEAHVLLADEQRQMDRKLSAILPDAPVPVADAAPGIKRTGGKKQRSN